MAQTRLRYLTLDDLEGHVAHEIDEMLAQSAIDQAFAMRPPSPFDGLFGGLSEEIVRRSAATLGKRLLR